MLIRHINADWLHGDTYLMTWEEVGVAPPVDAKCWLAKILKGVAEEVRKASSLV